MRRESQIALEALTLAVRCIDLAETESCSGGRRSIQSVGGHARAPVRQVLRVPAVYCSCGEAVCAQLPPPLVQFVNSRETCRSSAKPPDHSSCCTQTAWLTGSELRRGIRAKTDEWGTTGFFQTVCIVDTHRQRDFSRQVIRRLQIQNRFTGLVIMMSKQICILLTVCVIASTVGCSGSRVRNLVTRADYKSAEELDALDARTAEREAAARELALSAGETDNSTETDGLLVSSERDATNDEEESGDEAKDPSRFSFAGIASLFKRKNDDSEVTPDPFATASSSEDVATDEAGSDDPQPAVTIANADKTAMAPKDDRAEQLIAESTVKETAEDAPFNHDRDLSASSVANNTDVTAQSFADFLAERGPEDQMEITNSIATKLEDAQQELLAEAEIVEATENGAFDTLMRETAAEAREAEPAASLASELFPALDEIAAESEPALADHLGEQSPDAIFAELTGTSNSTPAVDHQESESLPEAFADAAEKHGFNVSQSQDPWAAFNRTQPAASDKSSRHSDFSWASQSVENAAFDPASAAQEQADSNPFSSNGMGLTQVSSEDVAPASPFTSVSASNSADDDSTIQQQPSQLVIPDANTTPQIVPVETDDSASGSDPFFDSSLSENPQVSLDPEAGTADAALAAPAVTGFRWTPRMWFLLIGCVIVAILLFLPDRQKQANA